MQYRQNKSMRYFLWTTIPNMQQGERPYQFSLLLKTPLTFRYYFSIEEMLWLSADFLDKS
jgi:hypothetical protein